MKKHSDFMEEALKEAAIAAAAGEVPVGCVIVRNGDIIASGHNTRESEQSAIGHAEINAITAACRALSSWRLTDCSIYVTLEPCPMCMGAILNSRAARLIYGVDDSSAGCCGSLVNLNEISYPHHLEILAGISEEKCRAMLTDFFKKIRG